MRKTSQHFSQSTMLCKVALVAIMLAFQAMLGIGAGVLNAQNVTGTVISGSDNEPLIGASVMVQGTKVGSVTDLDGNFSIEAKNGQTLEVSYLGFITQKVKVNGTKLNITLQEDKHSLDEVVVVGYGVQKKKLVTGATVQMKGDEVAKLNTTSPLQAMQGQTPGVNIQSTSGQPGEDMKVVIRGLGTVGNSGPLYLIDGVGGDISTVNPADIESIDILKDAASAAIYGAQAANGVVLVTTKHGQEGRARVSFDAYKGWQSAARKLKMLNAKEYMAIMDEQSVNSGNGLIDWSKYSLADADGNAYDTDWIDQMLKDNASTESYNLSITGGGKAATYALSLGYMSQEGIMGGKAVSDYERYNFRLNSDQTVASWLKIGEQLGVVYKKTKGINVGDFNNNSLRSAYAASPLMPVYATKIYDGAPSEVVNQGFNGFYGQPYYDTSSDGSWWPEQGNPYGSMMINNQNLNKNVAFTGNLYAEAEPIKNLKFRTQLGMVYTTSNYRDYRPLYHLSTYSFNESKTTVSQSMNHGLSMTWTNTLTYNFKIKDHEFTPMLGMESYRYEGSYLRGANGILKDGFNDWGHAYLDNTSGTTQDDGLAAQGAPHDKTRTVSYFGRLGWNWKETYMVNATLRADGSSRFARGHRYGWFPSVSAGWTISNEKFMEKAKNFIDYLKLRASWGQVGNQNIDNYQYLSPIKTSNTHYNFGTGMGAPAQSANWGAYPSRLSNESLTWETSEQTNIGIDARLVNSHLNVNLDWYWKTTKDWLVQKPILATAGTGAPFINGGDVKNYGLEVNLSWNDRIGKDFTYNIGVNGAWNHNEVGNIPTEDGIIHGKSSMIYDNSGEFYRAQNGHVIGYFWGWKTAGIFQNQQEIDEWIAAGNGVKQADVKPGDVKYVDVDHNGTIDEADKVDLGNGVPDFTMGFNISLGYKNFDFSMTANGAFGQQIVQAYRNTTNKKANYTSAVLKRWTGEGTSNKYPRVTEENINWEFSDLYLQDGDYLRISNVTLGYDFAKLLNWKVISQARLYFQVQNLYTFTKYDGMDPEVGYGSDSWVSGIDVGYYPRPRTFLVGVNVKF